MPIIRDGESRRHIFNSGLEVWLYDDSRQDAIGRSGAMEFGSEGADAAFAALTAAGDLLGYSLWQDDELDVSVIAGRPLTAAELAAGRWLEPQRGWLRLPSGVLRIDSNDTAPFGADAATDPGARVDVPPGNYVVTLYRVDHEALQREGLAWDGPQEVVVLTRGERPADAATGALPFLHRRDTGWIGRYTVRGRHAEGLAWFGDYWDTCFVNLDAKAIDAMNIAPGTYLRIDVPALAITLTAVFDRDWQSASRRPPPAAGSLPDEYAYCAVMPAADWQGADALYCRRTRAARGITDAEMRQWFPATIARLDLKPAAAEPAGSSARQFRAARLREQQYFEPDFLPLILSDVIGEIGYDAPFDEVVDLLDRGMKTLGLNAPADYSHVERDRSGEREFTCRLYSGPADLFGAIAATDGSIEIVLLSELADGAWVVTGLADLTETRLTIGQRRPSIRMQNLDAPLKKILSAHRRALAGAGERRPAPPAGRATLAAYERFLSAAFD